MYSIHDYGDMTAERRRNDPYARAIRSNITPTSVVLEIGVGAGIMTLLACQAGARKVYAVESEGIIEVARETIAANGYGDRVEFIQGLSTAVSLPEQVDVILSDVHGVLPFFYGSLTAILDARDRFLKPGGVLIPRKETVWVSIATAPALYGTIVGPWRAEDGLDFSPAFRRAVNTWKRWRADPAALLVDPKAWTVVDYASLTDASVKGSVDWTVASAGMAHGLCMWFDCETTPGVGFSNAPGDIEMRLYNHGFFPWAEPCRLEPEDMVHVDIRADAVGEDYVWSWATDIRGAEPARPVKAQFRQSGFLGAPISTDWMRKANASFVPSPNGEALIDKMILDQLIAGTTVGDIARAVAQRFPERFPEWRKALTRVGELSMRYSQ